MAGHLSHGGDVDTEFLVPINTQQAISQSLVVGCYGACSGSDGITCQIEVLTDMAGVQRNDLVGRLGLAPLSALWNSRPEEGYRRLTGKTLTSGCSGKVGW